MLDKINNNTAELKTPQQYVDDWLYEQTQGIVQIGPFKGMRILHEIAWKDTALSPMLLGTYEQELHSILEYEIARLSGLPNPKIAVIGCAEGYYAVGLKRRLPKATVWVVDIDPEAINLTGKNAAANDVDLVAGADMPEIFKEPDLIVMDCEGSEMAYLQLEDYPGLYKATIIVEIHNLIGVPRTDETLKERFHPTHDIFNIYEGARNPNEIPLLLPTPSALRWMCVCENRPCCMNWFVMRPSHETSAARGEGSE